ncbi:acyltransferase family protein [Paraburkholderia acidiphila]|uniref:Acyltransferase family protein n=1 Tax=Paraburkholderia acidiphila TaxID=2571747 RepID=A0A7Z2J833_9BURK|nr:acyltransferase [Paraburkholderia acidiphila]QGZ53949.1 acyltransferase family protein [Paraburkholderia acidiphila]
MVALPLARSGAHGADARQARAPGPVLAPSVSVALDLIRFLLALTVVIGHCTQRYFQYEWPDLTGAAVVAVGGFFVLSGYTIRSFSPPSPSFDLQRFFVDRASRLLSISLPALALTVLLDAYASSASPQWYALCWGSDATQPVLRLLANATLFSQSWGADIVPFSNSPFWSLSYEAGFYAIWAALAYARTRRHSFALPLAVALLFGPNIIAMMMLWLVGVAIYDLFARTLSRRTLLLLAVGSVCAALLLATCYLPFKPVLQSSIEWLFDLVGGNRQRIGASLVFGAVMFCFFMVALLAVLRLYEPRLHVSRRVVRAARRAGEATFPLYLMHFPMLVAATAAHLYNPHSSLQKILLLAALVLAAFVAAPIGARLKNLLRALFNRALTRQTA